MALEIGQQVRRPGQRLVKPIVAFGAIVKLRSREHNGSADIYGTNHSRWRVFLSAFGVYKYIHPGGTGDLHASQITPTLNKANNPAKYMAWSDWYFASAPKCWAAECPIAERRYRSFTLFPAALKGTPAPLDAAGRPSCPPRNASGSRDRRDVRRAL